MLFGSAVLAVPSRREGSWCGERGETMPAKQKQNGQRQRSNKRLQQTTVQLLRPILGRPQTQLGPISVRRRATDRFAVLGMPVQRVEVQPDGAVGLLTDAG